MFFLERITFGLFQDISLKPALWNNGGENCQMI